MTEYSSAAERRAAALARVDNAKFGFQHVKAIVVAGVGFFTDAYDLFAVNMATLFFGYVYYNTGVTSTGADTAIKVSTQAGNVIGQVGFGALADIVGRKKMYAVCLFIMIFGTLAQALTSKGPAVSFTGAIVFWRVFMGIGIGGDYPVASIITSEFATTKWRGAMMSAVFAMQGFGQFTASLVSMICISAYRSKLEPFNSALACNQSETCRLANDQIWRIVIGFGCVPAVMAVYYRLTIPETPRYTIDIERNLSKGSADADAYLGGKRGGNLDITKGVAVLANDQEHAPPKASFKDFVRHFSQWRYGKVLLGTAGSWFFLDVAFYGLGLNNSFILQAIGYANQPNVFRNLHNAAAGNLIFSVAGLIPGYWVSVATIDTIGRKPIQIGGFIILTILFIVIGFGFHSISGNGLFALYVFAQFFFNFGPNTTTFIVPGECFPTRYRSTAHGLSAAAGKLGAIIAVLLIGPLRNRGGKNKWLNHVMQIFALFMFLGIFTSFLIPETKRKSLEELAEEDYVPAQHNHRTPSNESQEVAEKV